MDVLLSGLRIERAGHGSMAAQLARQIRAAIHEGRLAAGEKLPPSRDLGAQLGLGRNTVVQAYEQLAAEGWLVGMGRRGTRVAESRPAPSAETPKLIRRLTQPMSAQVAPAFDWRLGQAAAVPLPLEVWRAATREAGRSLPPNGYGDPGGDATLRDAIAGWLAQHRRLHVSPEQVVVTQGASQAIELIAQLLLRPGDACCVENPGYVRAAQAFARHGGQVRPVPIDADGMDVREAFAGARKPALVHVTAAHHYPLGVRMPGARRRELLALAARHGAVVIENEYDHEFVHAGPNHAPLFASAPQQVLLVSTFAKAISPSMRLGFVVAEPGIAGRLAELVARDKQHVSWPVQRSVAWLIRRGELDRHLRRVRRHTAQLRALVVEQLSARDTPLRFAGEDGGLHLVLRMRSARDTARLAEALRARGVALELLDDFKLAKTPDHGILMAYGHMGEADALTACATLREAVAACAARR
ncbi:MAG: PLP-dependent aminotransferase family protein [Pseudomonadota bacterium]